MNKVKKLVSLLLCLAMIFALSVTAFANYDTDAVEANEARATITVGGDGFVTGTGVNLRSGPGTNYATYGTVYKPDAFTVDAIYSSWYKVTMKDGGLSGTTGYISSSYATGGRSLNKWRVSAQSGANLRAGAGVNNTALCLLSYGVTFYVTGESWNSSEGYTWYKVCVTSGANQGTTGYLRSDVVGYW